MIRYQTLNKLGLHTIVTTPDKTLGMISGFDKEMKKYSVLPYHMGK